MTVTEVRIRRRVAVGEENGPVRAVCSIIFDNSFAVHGVKIIKGQKGLFVSYPSMRTPEGEYRDVCHPITAEMRDTIQKIVLDAYRNAGGQDD